LNFYKHYIGDFQRDTGHLSLTERGAYLALIHHYYATENPLPNNIDALCRIAGAVSAIERKAVKVAIKFFEIVDSGLMHSRIEAEIHKAGEQSNTNRDIALAREAKRRADKLAKEEHEKSTNRAESVPRKEHENSTNHTPDTIPHLKPDEVTHIVEDLPIVEPTQIGRVCSAIQIEYKLQNKAVLDMSQANPTFIALIEAGATVEEFADAARRSASSDKGFGYVVGIVKRQREEALKLKVLKGPIPVNSSRDQGRNVAAKSIFKPQHTQHLMGGNNQEIEVTDAKAITA
jgi:uncharacterized protein YdaU (DUF1376 family)